MMWEPIRFLESCPSLRRRLRGRAHRRGRRQGRRRRRPARRRGSSARRRARSRRASPGATRSGPQACIVVRRRRLHDGRHHQSPRADRHGRAVRAVLVARGDLAGGPRPRRRGRGLEDDRRRHDRARRLASRSTPRAACCRATRSARRASCASPRRPTRCAAPPASTRSTGPSVALGDGLRRQQPVLQHVGRRELAPALRLRSRSSTGACGASPARRAPPRGGGVSPPSAQPGTRRG